jgi:hypothetical protein
MLALHPRVALAMRTFFVAAAAISITACGGGGSSSGTLPPNPSESLCAQDTQVQLAIPSPNSSGNGSPSQIVIVANGQNNSLYQSYQNFDLLIAPPNTNPATNGYSSAYLTLTSGNGAPHPYQSDYYYSAPTPNLPYSSAYSVYLNNPSGYCQPQYLGTFSS